MNILVPNLTSQKVRILLKQMKNENIPQYIEVVPESYALVNECFPNVEKKISKDGGEMILGWQIWETSLILEAEYHSIWKKEKVLIDITPKQIPVNKILFVQDEKLLYDKKIIDNIRVNLTANSVIDDFIKLCDLKYEIINYKDRAYSTEIIIAKDEQLVIEKIIELSHNLEIFCKLKNDQHSMCFCNSGIDYYNCHGNEIHCFIGKVSGNYNKKL